MTISNSLFSHAAASGILMLVVFGTKAMAQQVHTETIPVPLGLWQSCSRMEVETKRFNTAVSDLRRSQDSLKQCVEAGCCIGTECGNDAIRVLADRTTSLSRSEQVAKGSLEVLRSRFIHFAGWLVKSESAMLAFVMGERVNIYSSTVGYIEKYKSSFPTIIFNADVLTIDEVSLELKSIGRVVSEVEAPEYRDGSASVAIDFFYADGELVRQLTPREGKIGYTVSGQIGEVCDLITSSGGTLFSLAKTLPASTEIPAGLDLTFSVGIANFKNYSLEDASNIEFVRIIEPLMKNFFDIPPPKPSAFQTRRPRCDWPNVAEGSFDIGEAIGNLRLRLSQIVGGDTWPTPTTLAQNAEWDFGFLDQPIDPFSKGYVPTLDALTPYLRVHLFYKDEYFGTIVMVRDPSNPGTVFQFPTMQFRLIASPDQLLFGCE